MLDVKHVITKSEEVVYCFVNKTIQLLNSFIASIFKSNNVHLEFSQLIDLLGIVDSLEQIDSATRNVIIIDRY